LQRVNDGESERIVNVVADIGVEDQRHRIGGEEHDREEKGSSKRAHAASLTLDHAHGS
jgi:hypothetical protein